MVLVRGARRRNLRVTEPGGQAGAGVVEAVVGASGLRKAAVVLELGPFAVGVGVALGRAVGVAGDGVLEGLLVGGVRRQQAVGGVVEAVADLLEALALGEGEGWSCLGGVVSEDSCAGWPFELGCWAPGLLFGV